MPRLTIKLDIAEYDALLRLAECERRDMRGQAAIIIRRELERLDLLAVPRKEVVTPAETKEGHQ